MSQSNKKIKKIAEKEYKKALKQISKIVGNKTTYSDDLEKAGKKLFRKKFLGVFSSDLIPNKIPNGYMAIVNLDNSKMSGSHWVSICKQNNNDTIWVYDSFGRNIYEILPDIYNKKRKIRSTEKDAEQRIDETNCGARSLAFLKVFHEYGIKYAKFI